MSTEDFASAARRAYDAIGQRYSLQTDPFKSRVAYPLLSARLSEALGTLHEKQILDVGCGSGNLMEVLAKDGAVCEGIDISPQSVMRAKMKGLRATEASMLRLPFSPESFAAAVSFHSFNYTPYDRQVDAFAEQHRVLKSNGVLLAVCLFSTEETPREIRLPMLGEEFLLYPCSQSRLEALLQEASFIDINCEVLNCEASLLEELIRSSTNPDEIELLSASRGRPYGLLVSGRKP